MQRFLVNAALAFAVLLAACMPAEAHKRDRLLAFRPYVIEKTCNDHYKRCKPRMVYAPGEHAGLAGPGSYWYQKPPGYRNHGDFKISGPRYKHHTHRHTVRHKHLAHRKHACRKAGWVFDVNHVRFDSGVPRAARCIRSYDWQ